MSGYIECFTAVASKSVRSDRDGADEGSTLQQDAENQEHEVQNKHGESQHPTHFPAARSDGDDDEEQHEEEEHNGAEEAVGAHGYRVAFV